jgi:predicted metal-binding membrane protein
MVRRFSRVIGCCYLLLAVLNVVRHGVLSLAWIAWALLSFGALSLVYTPVEEGGKTEYELVFSGRNRLSAAATLLGVVLLILLILVRH